jgi:hypothetical protein
VPSWGSKYVRKTMMIHFGDEQISINGKFWHWYFSFWYTWNAYSPCLLTKPRWPGRQETKCKQHLPFNWIKVRDQILMPTFLLWMKELSISTGKETWDPDLIWMRWKWKSVLLHKM